ncbi:MAG: C69 family dipeptidase, partial [Bacteroidales bacterium]|nr:C69 family dipeptidase [Bacteroidales bacterium]
MKKLIISGFVFCSFSLVAQIDIRDLDAVGMECTSVTIGKKASVDGSVMTSHTDDSHRSRTNILVTPAADHAPGEMQKLYKRIYAPTEAGKPARYSSVEVGEIPQVAHTYQY